MENQNAENPREVAPLRKKRQGKGAKQRAQDRYREKRNDQQREEHMASLRAKYGLDDDAGALTTIANNASSVVVPTAVPLHVTTRGVGFNVHQAYTAIEDAIGVEDTHSRCTIHEFYRVMLYAVSRKLSLATIVQTEITTDADYINVNSTREIDDLMNGLGKVPSVLAMLVNAIGRVEIGDSIYHAGIPVVNTLLVEEQINPSRYFFLCAENIRQILMDLVVHADPDFVLNNPVPGLTFAGGLATNVDAVWPNVPPVFEDVSRFKRLMERCSAKLPNSFFSQIEWTGRGRTLLLWSCEPLINMRLVNDPRQEVVRNLRARNASGVLVNDERRVTSITRTLHSLNRYTKHWCIESIKDGVDSYLASAIMLGEDVMFVARHQSVSRVMTDQSPLISMRNLVITDRKA